MSPKEYRPSEYFIVFTDPPVKTVEWEACPYRVLAESEEDALAQVNEDIFKWAGLGEQYEEETDAFACPNADCQETAMVTIDMVLEVGTPQCPSCDCDMDRKGPAEEEPYDARFYLDSGRLAECAAMWKAPLLEGPVRVQSIRKEVKGQEYWPDTYYLERRQ